MKKDVYVVDIMIDEQTKEVRLDIEGVAGEQSSLLLSREVEESLYDILHQRRIKRHRELLRGSQGDYPCDYMEGFDDLPAGTSPVYPDYDY